MAFGLNCKFGIPTLLELPDIRQLARTASVNGLDFIELNMNMPEFQPNAIDIDELNKLRDEYGVYFTFHLDENLNVSDFNEYVSKAYLRTVRETIAIANEIDAPVINLHMPDGVYFTLEGDKKYLFDIYKERFLQAFKKFVDLCDGIINGAYPIICIENTNGFKEYQTEAVEYALSSRRFALTYDAGHDYGTGFRDAAFYKENSERIAHIHLHDAAGNKNHLALGDGEIEVLRILDYADKAATGVVLETKTLIALNKSIDYLNKITSRR